MERDNQTTMKLLITGSRKCVESDYVKFESFLNDLIVEKDLEITEIIHGGAKGADQFADRWAKARHIPVSICNRAPLVRNNVMVELCDVCVAVFKEVKTSRTLYTANAASARKKLIGEIILE